MESADDLFEGIVMSEESPTEHRKAELIYAGKVSNRRAEKFVTNRIYCTVAKDMKRALLKEIMSVRQKANSMEPHMGQVLDLSPEACTYISERPPVIEWMTSHKNLWENKKIKTLDSLITMIQSFPTDDPSHDKLQDELAAIRGKVKQVCSMLNVQPDFRVNYENSGLSF